MKWFDNTALTLVIIGAVKDHLYASRFVRLILDQSFWQNQINVRIKEKHLVK